MKMKTIYFGNPKQRENKIKIPIFFTPAKATPIFTYANLDTVYKNNPIQKRIFIISILLYPILANSG